MLKKDSYKARTIFRQRHLIPLRNLADALFDLYSGKRKSVTFTLIGQRWQITPLQNSQNNYKAIE